MSDDSDAPASPISDAAISRRRALRAAVGTGVAAAVWTAPRVDGLTIRPNYASAQSVPATSVTGFIIILEEGCNNANPNLQKFPLPGLTFTLMGKLNENLFDWTLTGTVAGTTNCRVTAMTCSYESGDPDETPLGFMEGTAGSGLECFACCSNNSCLVSLRIDVECDVI